MMASEEGFWVNSIKTARTGSTTLYVGQSSAPGATLSTQTPQITLTASSVKWPLLSCNLEWSLVFSTRTKRKLYGSRTQIDLPSMRAYPIGAGTDNL